MGDETFEPPRDDAILLGLLLDPPTVWTADELARDLGWPSYRTEDALAALARCGLVHRYAELAFATRAARCGRVLGGG